MNSPKTKRYSKIFCKNSSKDFSRNTPKNFTKIRRMIIFIPRLLPCFSRGSIWCLWMFSRILLEIPLGNLPNTLP